MTTAPATASPAIGSRAAYGTSGTSAGGAGATPYGVSVAFCAPGMSTAEPGSTATWKAAAFGRRYGMSADDSDSRRWWPAGNVQAIANASNVDVCTPGAPPPGCSAYAPR